MKMRMSRGNESSDVKHAPSARPPVVTRRVVDVPLSALDLTMSVTPGNVAAMLPTLMATAAAAMAKQTASISGVTFNTVVRPIGCPELEVECADGTVLAVTHEEAMMSSTMWMLLQDVIDLRKRALQPSPYVCQHGIVVDDVPPESVKLALQYCRECLYKQQVEGHDQAMQEWEKTFLALDLKTLCDLAKAASRLDIQPLIDVTCRSVAQVMSSTESAHEIREKIGLTTQPANPRGCTCEDHFDLDMLNSLDLGLCTEALKQPSVDELVSFINGDSSSQPNSGGASATQSKSTVQKGSTHVNDKMEAGNAGEGIGSSSTSSKKKKRRKKKKRASQFTSSGGEEQESHNCEPNDEDDDEEEDDLPPGDNGVRSIKDVELLEQKLRLAAQNPGAIFQESQFEDDEDEELDEQIESFRLALESAHRDSKSKSKRRPRLQFVPQDVFRTGATHRHQRATTS